MKTTKVLFIILAVSCSLQVMVRDAGSCSVPVFRYALERWKPDPYKGIFIHRGPLSKQDQVLLRQLEDASQNAEATLNLLVRPVEIAEFSEAKLKDLLKGPIPGRLPALAIWYPDQMGKKPPLWTVDATPGIVKALAMSPQRRRVAEGLIGGESIVWIFVPSGHSRKDAEAKATIQRELGVALDYMDKNPFFVQSGVRKKKLTYEFPLVTIARTDPEERYFLDMLLHCESDLSEFKDEPMVFPVFGRGRTLGCLFGEYINEKSIQGVISYLAASCSCDVKAQHPGIDLLFAAFWDKVTMGVLFSEEDDQVPELTGVMPDAPRPVKAQAAPQATPTLQGVPQPAGSEGAPSEKSPKHTGIFAVYGITLGAVVVVVVSASLVLNYRRKENR